MVVVCAVSGVTESLIQFICQQRKEDEVEAFIKGCEDKHIALLTESVRQTRPSRRRRRAKIKDKLVKLERTLYGVMYLEEVTPRTKDFVQCWARGCRVIVVAAMLHDMGVKAVPVDADELGIITDGMYGAASAVLDATAKNICPRIRQMFDTEETPVVTGFFGRTTKGHVTVFGRNGSDYSAAVIANALDADVLEIWKDVDGFMSVDPKIVPEAVPIDTLSYDEAAELSYFGAKVLHPRTVEPAEDEEHHHQGQERLQARAAGDGHQAVGGAEGAGHQVHILHEEHGHHQDLRRGRGHQDRRHVGDLQQAHRRGREHLLRGHVPDLHRHADRQEGPAPWRRRRPGDVKKGVIERIETNDDVALLCMVGEGLGYEKGIASRVFTAVAKEGVSVD